jgi:hypothetical protein
MRQLVISLVLAAAVLASGCQKKDRLSGGEASFSITPPAATALRNSPVTLTARGGGSTEIVAVWEVSPSTMGTISPAVGQTVEFNPSSLGDATVIATYGGVQATAHIAVVTYIPNSNTFDVYTDSLIPNDSTEFSSGLQLFTGGGMTVEERSDGYTTQGVDYQRATGGTNAFWGIALDRNDVGLSKNLSTFSSGNLKFSIRFPTALGATQDVRIDIRDASVTDSVTLNGTHGLNRLSTEWQEISIPIIQFGGGANLATIENPFAVLLQNITTSLTFDIDAIRWEK